jgi:glycerol-3-phosphate dehydrogenase
VRRTKGIHFTAPATVNNAIVLFAEDNRLFFVIPWMGYAWVGTTDTDFNEELESVRATRDDVEYLLDTVREIFPKSDWDTIYFTNAGVRALVRKGKAGDKDESAVSRKHALVDHGTHGDNPGLVSVVGGKITGYRGIAEDAVDLAAKKLGLNAESTTAKEALPGGATGKIEEFTAQFQVKAAKSGVTAEQAAHLVNIYGSRAVEVLALVEADPALAAPIHPAYPTILAQLRFAVEQEQCLTLSDFMMRRTDLYFKPDQGRQAAPTVSEELAKLLGWSEERRHLEEATYAQELAWTQEWKEQPSKTASTPAELITTK